MADVPLLKLARLGLYMKLQGQGTAAKSEGLILVVLTVGEPGSLLRQIKRIGMPVQDDSAITVQGSKTRRSSFFGEVNLLPTDLLVGAREYLTSQSPCHQLGAETDSQRWKIAGKPRFDESNLRVKKRIVGRFVDADGTTKANDQVGIFDRRVGEVIHRGFAERDVPPLTLHDRREQPQIFECNMTNSYGGSLVVHHWEESMLKLTAMDQLAAIGIS